MAKSRINLWVVRAQYAWLEYLGAIRNVTRQVRRSLFGIAAVAFGIIALVLASGFIDWIFWAAREGAIQNGLGHVHVIRPGYLEGGQSDPLRYLLPETSEQRKAITQFPKVRTLAPRLAFNGLISHKEATISFVGEGVSPDEERQVSRVLNIADGENLSTADPKGILLGQGLADNLGVKVGDTVVLLATASTGSINAVECTVRGIFTTVSKAYDDSAIRTPLTKAQDLMRVSSGHRWILLLDDTSHTTMTVQGLRARFQDGSLQFVPWYELADFYNKLVALLSKQIGVVEFIIAAIIVLSISNTMIMNVMERTTEIGTAMAIGRTRRQIRRQFVFEGLTIGLVGGVIGLTAAWILALVISKIGIPMPPPPGMSKGYSGEILVTSSLMTRAFLLAVGATLLACLYPAWKASRMEIVNALRHNR